MIVVHHLENSRSQRILWLLEELDLPYEIRHYKRDVQTRLAPAELLSVHPLGKSPVITDGDTTVAESGAIVDYVLTHHGGGRLLPPADSPEYLRYNYWLHYAEGSFMPLMILSLIMNRIETGPMPFFVRPIARGIAGKVRQSYLDPNVRRNLEFMEATLTADPWFSGSQMTGADILMSFPVEAASVRTSLKDDYPRLEDFLRRIQARPAWQRALEKGGPYELMR